MSRIERMYAQLAVLNPVSINIVDESHKHAGHAGARDGAGHYLLQIVTSEFAGKTTISRHRMIYSALGEMMQREIHALNIQATTPNEV
ncbi:MAG: BolA family protein [Gallionella sp.]|jgi:BolA protein